MVLNLGRFELLEGAFQHKRVDPHALIVRGVDGPAGVPGNMHVVKALQVIWIYSPRGIAGRKE